MFILSTNLTYKDSVDLFYRSCVRVILFPKHYSFRKISEVHVFFCILYDTSLYDCKGVSVTLLFTTPLTYITFLNFHRTSKSRIIIVQNFISPVVITLFLLSYVTDYRTISQ